MIPRYVLISVLALGASAEPTAHEYLRAGETVCGIRFYITLADPGEKRMEFINRRHAEKFSRPCRRCQR